ncbi:chorismate-binding protein, partial [Amycolatopsis sp. NPDC000673]
IKGTLPRRGPADDGNALRLRQSAKDVAENVMITDLVRNDLGRVCEVGSVVVPELLAVHPAPGVWHLASTVEGVLADEVTDHGLLAATFPPGSVTGAPKIRALDLIAELEPAARGVYTGAVGMVSPLAGLELNVAIRTFEIAGDRIALGVGGGITADSDSAAEWQECLHKAAPLESLLARPGEC